MARSELIEVPDVLSLCCQAPVWRMGIVEFCGLCLMEQSSDRNTETTDEWWDE